MEMLDGKVRRDARQVWMELELRETWHVDGPPASCMGSPRYYILHNGQVRETDFPAWAAWAYTHLPDRLIRHTLIENVRVDSVFLAFDQGYIGEGPALLFETVVQGGPLNGRSARYTMMDDALLGHEVMVERVERGTLINT